MQAQVNWKKELEDLVASAKTAKEKAAVEAFARALGPHLENPDTLRTLLGKIQRDLPEGTVGVVVAKGRFESVEQLKSELPKDINVIVL